MPAPVIAADRQVEPVRHKGALIALASRTRITGAATVQQPQQDGAEHGRNAYASDRPKSPYISHTRVRTRQDAPGKPLAPLHGGGEGFESPRLHFKN